MTNLSNLKAKNINPEDGPLSDGTVPGLRLEPGQAKGRGKWTLRFVSPVTGKRRDMGLSTYPDVSISDARKLALSARDLIRQGIDPIEDRTAKKQTQRAQSKIYTFQEAAEVVHENLKDGWSSARHAENWISSLEMYVFPGLGRRKVTDLKARDFADSLRPIWIKRADTASRIKQRCSVIMDWCVAGDIIEANPVSVVDKLLSKQPGARARVQHQPSVPWRGVPDLVKEVLHEGKRSLSKLMLEFLILTAARSGEVRAMTWEEVDFETDTWTVPAARMKSKLDHRVPLSGRAVEILEHQKTKTNGVGIVFPSLRGKVPSDAILSKFLRDHSVKSTDPNRTATPHGFRSSFRDWASENGFSRDLAERALAHIIKNASEAAYHRTDLLEQRRTMMAAWSTYVGAASPSTNVIALHKVTAS
jgi:integrase